MAPIETLTVLLGDPGLPDQSKPGGQFTDDDLDQVVRLKTALAGIDAHRFEYWNDHRTLLARLERERPGLVVNFCDTGFRNRAAHELHVAAYLEMLDLDYSGSGPVALGLCFDKSLVRAAAGALGMGVPRERFIAARADAPAALADVEWPAFVKPNRADGSVGITARSIVDGRDAALETVSELRRTLPGTDVIVQEFLPGQEFSVGLVGNPGAGFDVLPILEVDYSGLADGLPHLLDYGSKTDPASPYWTDVRFRAATLTDTERHETGGWCERLFARLDLRDYARFDFRRAPNGAVRLLEVNPNPAWCHDGKLAHMVSLRGERHTDLLASIIGAFLRRVRATP